ncbi:MAG TPA: phosphotransferase [Spirillospora sp.]
MRIENARPELYDRLVEIGRDAAGASPSSGPSPSSSPAEPEILYRRHGVLVVRVGDVVVKAHRADRADGPSFPSRMKLAASLPDLLVAPFRRLTVDGRTVTVSAFAEPVDPGGRLPWEEGARLLSELHTAPVPADAPPWGGPGRVARLVSSLGHGPAEDEVRRAFATLPSWIREQGREPSGPGVRLIHGDWHLGQMVHIGDGRWRLIDIDDLGAGDPAWDLARPAALYSAGVLPAEDWSRFLGAYQAAGGPAVPADGDLWSALDVPARTLAIQIAATCVKDARKDDRPLDEAEQAMIDACARISAAGDAA